MLELLCAIFALKSLTIGSFTNILKKPSIFIGPPFVSQRVWMAWFPKCRSAATAERGSREGTCVPCENGSCVCGNCISGVVCDGRAQPGLRLFSLPAPRRPPESSRQHREAASFWKVLFSNRNRRHFQSLLLSFWLCKRSRSPRLCPLSIWSEVTSDFVG